MHQLVLLAMNRNGYRNLTELVSLGWIDGFFYEPRVDIDLIRQYQEDLICLSGTGPDGFLNRHLQVGAKEEAQRQASISQDIFGDRLYLESVTISPASIVTLTWLRSVNSSTSPWSQPIGCITSQIADDARYHDVQLTVQKATTIDDPRRKRMPSEEFYFKTGDQMAELFARYPQQSAIPWRLLIALKTK